MYIIVRNNKTILLLRRNHKVRRFFYEVIAYAFYTFKQLCKTKKDKRINIPYLDITKKYLGHLIVYYTTLEQ